MSEWLVRFRPKSPSATITLLCFPFAGGSAHAFREWADDLPASIDMLAVQYPGRAMRMRQPLLHHSSDVVDGLLSAEFGLLLTQPVALFGHSMGALLAYELARAMQRRRLPTPLHLFASGYHAPHLPGKRHDNPVSGLTDAQFIELLKRINGTPAEVMANPELMALMLPVLRADFGVCDTYEPILPDPLDCPITALGGRYDLEVSPEKLEAWSAHTQAAFATHVYDGDHFYLNDFRPKLTQLVVSTLRQRLLTR